MTTEMATAKKPKHRAQDRIEKITRENRALRSENAALKAENEKLDALLAEAHAAAEHLFRLNEHLATGRGLNALLSRMDNAGMN